MSTKHHRQDGQTDRVWGIYNEEFDALKKQETNDTMEHNVAKLCFGKSVISNAP